jgi:glyoxalase/bleomycin resistance protein/dioxygenase superfamily protein
MAPIESRPDTAPQRRRIAAMREPVFTETLQVALVVRDLEAAMRRYVDAFGIGPWEIYEFNPGTVEHMQEDGQPVERSWRLAIAYVGQVQWELIQPLDDDSIYARYLAEHGEGVHHVGVATPSFEGTIAALEEHGSGVAFGGEYNGVTFAYLSTEPELGVMTEIFDAPPGLEQKPDAVYPS